MIGRGHPNDETTTRYHKIAAILQTDNYAHFHHTIPKTSLPRPPYATSAALVRRHVPPGGLTQVNMREYTEDDMIAELRALGITNENIPEYRKHRLIDYFLTYKEEQMKKLEKAEEVIIPDKKCLNNYQHQQVWMLDIRVSNIRRLLVH